MPYQYSRQKVTGLYGFDVRGFETFPKLRMHYWANVLHILKKKVGAEVVVTGVPGYAAD